MKLKRWRILCVAVPLLVGTVAVAAVTAGCGGNGSDNASANPVDVAFAAEMIPHHQSAIEMAGAAKKQAEHSEVRQLADNIISAQNAEIQVLRRIEGDLDEMGVEHGDLGLSEHAMGMDGQMAELEHAKPFDRTFIEMMTAHHQGAIRMARKELADGRDKALRKIADDIIAAQTREIAEMRDWSKHWYGKEESGVHMGGSM